MPVRDQIISLGLIDVAAASEESLMAKTIFKRIIDREIPADIVYEDDRCVAFRDVSPQAPVHVLLIPKKEISNLDAAGDEDAALLGHLMLVVRSLTRQSKLDRGYRVVLNC